MDKNQQTVYQPRMSRRESLKWMGMLAASTAFPGLAGCSDGNDTAIERTATGHWPEVSVKAVSAEGYGKDPNLIVAPESPWPRTLTDSQLTVVAILCEYIVPTEGDAPSARDVGVPDVIDEWVSAPYPGQHNDRITVLSMLGWLEDEAELRFGKPYSALTERKQQAILGDISVLNETTAEQFKQVGQAFSRFRALVLAGYFSSPYGTREIGYMGNVAIAGDYPGPTEEAMAHIDKVIADLGLTEYRYKSA